MLIPDMCCNRGDIKTDAWHMFYLCNGKCVGGEDPVTQIRAAAMVESWCTAGGSLYFSVGCTSGILPYQLI